jgi:enoyl-[acyl-carrier protein] reductase II
MGTRVLASHEAGVHANFKNEILAAGDDGTVMLDLPGNPTMRVLRTGLAARVAAAEPGIQLLGRITDLYFEGDMEASVANTGQVSSRIIDLQPAAQIVEQTWSDIAKALRDSRSRIGAVATG